MDSWSRRKSVRRPTRRIALGKSDNQREPGAAEGRFNAATDRRVQRQDDKGIQRRNQGRIQIVARHVPSLDMPPAKYRSNIAAIIMRPDGKILLGERVNIPNAWQFPQGGVKRSESPLQALHRELEEELSL